VTKPRKTSKNYGATRNPLADINSNECGLSRLPSPGAQRKVEAEKNNSQSPDQHSYNLEMRAACERNYGNIAKVITRCVALSGHYGMTELSF